MKILSVILILSILLTFICSCSPSASNAGAETSAQEESAPTEINLKLDRFSIVYDSKSEYSFIPKLAETVSEIIESKTGAKIQVLEDENEQELEILIGKCNRKEFKQHPKNLLFRDFFLYFENNKLSVSAVSIYGYEQAIGYLLEGYTEDGLTIPKDGLLVSYDYGTGAYAEIYKNYENPYIEGSWVVNVCHRGDVVTNSYPENSIPSYQSCIDNKVDVIEIDLKKTRDNVWVLCHDSALNRTTNGKGYIWNYLYKDLKQYIYLKAANGGDDAPLTTYQIPTLEECIDLCKGKALLNLDHISSDIFDEIYSVFEAKDAVDIAMFKSSDMSADQLTDWFCSLLVAEKKLPLYSPLLYGNNISYQESFKGLTSMVETGSDHEPATFYTAKTCNLRLMCLTALSPSLENNVYWSILINKGFGAIMNDSPTKFSELIHGN